MGRYGRLRVLDGNHRGEVFDLDGGDFALGRAPGSDFLLSDPTVSKRQARISCGSNGVILENLSAHNPPLIDDRPVAKTRSLKYGETVLFGTVHVEFLAPERAAAPPPPKPKPRPAPPPPKPAAPKPKGVRCPQCGAEETPDARWCSRCRAPLGESDSGPKGTHMLRRPWVTIEFPGGETREETLWDDVMRIGRGGDNAIQVDHETVSGRHAVLEKKGHGWTISDNGSTNGTFLNGKRIEKPERVTDGDIIRIGDLSGNSVALKFGEEGVVRDELGTVALGRLDVEGRDTFVLGRDPNCEVPLEGSLVSWRHARVEREGAGHVLSDLGSTNGTFVNGEAITGRHRLSAGEVISIGPYRFVYTASGFSKSSAAGSVRVDAVKVIRTVGSGSQQRVILDNISLSILPKEFVAFVGGSGAGKSTLMKSCAGILKIGGDVLVNGESLRAHYGQWKALLGYVPQDDIVHLDLTVDHAVRYAARLRLPKDTRPEELDKAVDRVLTDVEMIAHRDKVIRALSGGQRKRVSIAVEMLSEPSLFFLDEPTSGLDPGLEKKMMFMMRKLADGGRTIIMVTHATANVEQCNHVVFLSRGHLVWFGPPREALEHFGVKDFSDIYTEIEKDPATLAKKYRRSMAYTKYVVERQKALEGRTEKKKSAAPTQPARKRSPGAIRQFGILTKRYAELVFRDKLLLVILLAVMPVIGLMLAGISNANDLIGIADPAAVDAALVEKMAETGESMARHDVVRIAQTLLFMCALAVVLLGLFGASYELVKERAIYARERMVNLGVGSYLLSKVLVLFGFALVQCAALLGALMLKLDMPVEGIFMPAVAELYLTLVLTALASIAMGLFVSALTPNANTVIYIVLLVVFAQILLTGIIFDLPKAVKPASYGMLTRWSLEGLGTTVDMEALNEQTATRIDVDVALEKTVTVPVALKAEDLGESFAQMVELGQATVPPPMDLEHTASIEESVTRTIREPMKLEMRYAATKLNLQTLWIGLGGFVVGLLTLTSITLWWRDKQDV